MITMIILILFLLTVTVSLGGGLYEILVIYPNWKHDADPFTLKDKLESSGQNNAGKRFWPLVSPAQVLLSVINIILAWNYRGEAHVYWLAAAVAIFINRVITFSYFIPVMIRKIMQPEKIEAARLQSIVKQWTALSPLRLIPRVCCLVPAGYSFNTYLNCFKSGFEIAYIFQSVTDSFDARDTLRGFPVHEVIFTSEKAQQ